MTKPDHPLTARLEGSCWRLRDTSCRERPAAFGKVHKASLYTVDNQCDLSGDALPEFRALLEAPDLDGIVAAFETLERDLKQHRLLYGVEALPAWCNTEVPEFVVRWARVTWCDEQEARRARYENWGDTPAWQRSLAVAPRERGTGETLGSNR